MPHSSALLQAITDPSKLEAYLETHPQDIDAVDENSDDSILMRVTDLFLETGNENYRKSMLVLLRKGARHESWLDTTVDEIAADLVDARRKFKEFEVSLYKKAAARSQQDAVTLEDLKQYIEDGIDRSVGLLRMQCKKFQSAENPRHDIVIVGTNHCSFESNLFYEEVKEAMKKLGKTLILSEIGVEKLSPLERKNLWNLIVFFLVSHVMFLNL